MLDKKIGFIAILLLMACKGYCQIYKDFDKLNHVYKEWATGGCNTLYYTESISAEVLDETINSISSNKTFPLYELYIGKETQPFKITNDEQAYLVEELNKLRSFKWPASMFPKSKRITENQMSSVFAVTQKYPEEKYESCSVIYSFSKPIFFRNGTICLYIDQETYSKINIRLFTQFFAKINGRWEEYANVTTRLNEPNLKPDNAAEEMNANLLKAQVQEDLSLRNRLAPETVSEFGKRVFLTFKSQKPEQFNSLFPTLEQRTLIANEVGVASRRVASKEELEANHVAVLLKFNYDCQAARDAAKALKVNWAKATYLSTVTSETQTRVKDKAGKLLTIKDVSITFKDGLRTFNLNLKGVYLVGKVWKALGVGEIKETATK